MDRKKVNHFQFSLMKIQTRILWYICFRILTFIIYITQMYVVSSWGRVRVKHDCFVWDVKDVQHIRENFYQWKVNDIQLKTSEYMRIYAVLAEETEEGIKTPGNSPCHWYSLWFEKRLSLMMYYFSLHELRISTKDAFI